MEITMQFELREINTSKKYYTGSVWPTANCGDLKILGQLNIKSMKSSGYGSFRTFLCEFECGYKTESTGTAIKKGLIYNPFFKNVCNVGFIGIGEFKSRDKKGMTREYSVWKSMIYRCYSPNAYKTHPTYNDCFVDERWHNFQNFAKDIKRLIGYERWALNHEKMELDKDIKIKSNRTYSKDTCLFVTKKENTKEMNNRVNGKI